MGGERWARASDGKWVIDEDGKLIVCDQCPCVWELTPCVEPGTTCDECDDEDRVTPKYWTIDLSNVVIPTECDNVDDGSNWAQNITLPSSIKLEQTSDPCIWTTGGTIPATGQTDGVTASWKHVGFPNCPWDVDPYENNAKIYAAYNDSWGCGNLNANSGRLSVRVTADDGGTPLDVGEFLITDTNDGYRCCAAFTAACTHDAASGGGSVTATPGDTEDASSRCPGGSPIYTDTDLSSYAGKVVEIEGVCYQVSDGMVEGESDGSVTVTQCCDTCANCCDDDCSGDCT